MLASELHSCKECQQYRCGQVSAVGTKLSAEGVAAVRAALGESLELVLSGGVRKR